LHVVVCTKLTPDTTAKVTVDANGVVSWGDAKMVLNPWDEYAVEEAILLKENHSGTATVLCMGPEEHKEALKESVARGCDDARLLWDDHMAGADTLATATALAAALQKMGDVDIAVFGKQAIDGDTGQVAASVARKLGWPQLTYVFKVREINLDARTIVVERLLEEGRQVVQSRLPAVVSVVKDINEPRYPSFLGIRKASKLEIPVWTSADLGLDVGKIGASGSAVRWPEIANLPPRGGQVEFIEGTPEEQARALVDKLLAEKVI
jgi:electron transfer flavoprotein beta subunit